MTRHDRRAIASYLKAYVALRAKEDRDYEANRKAYGHSCPAYQPREAFRPEAWARWCRDRPNAINVVAARAADKPGPAMPAPKLPPASTITQERDTQKELF